MRVAVTGGRGFIGSVVQRELTVRGHEPISFDLPTHDVRTLVDLKGADAVIHLAGLLGTDELFDHAYDACVVNVLGTLNVLEAAKAAEASYVGITMPDAFPSIYTATKIGAMYLERAFNMTHGLPVSRVRAFNAYGPGQKFGPEHPQKILPTFAREAWAGRPIPIWGSGEQTVDLIYVDQLARLLVDALGHGDNITFDGGTGAALSVNEVARMVLEITGSDAGVVYRKMRRGETPTTIVAKGEGWERLHWTPTFDYGDFAETVWSYK